MRLVERGTLALGTTARSLLGDDLPLIADDVTVEHLLAHRSGIGDYLDEDAVADVTDYVLPVPVHELATTEQYLAVLDGHPTVFPAGERFAYNNGGYVVLALLAERASGVDFHELVHTLVCEPAGMVDTAFLRSDELPGRAARGYLAATACGRTSSTCRCSATATAASTRPLPTSAPSGTRCSPGGSSLRSGSPRWCGRAATGRRSPALRPRVPPRRDRATASSSRGTTPACRSRSLHRPVLDHLHRHLELVGRRLADRPAPR